jgi:hypothetical protein
MLNRHIGFVVCRFNLELARSEPDRGRRDWSKAPDAQAPVYANRRGFAAAGVAA